MLFKKLVLEWKYDLFSDIIKNLRKDLIQRKRTLCTLHDLEPLLLQTIDHSQASGIKTNLLCPDMDIYIQTISLINATLQENQIVNRNIINFNDSISFIDNLFISKNGHYIDHYTSIKKFKDVSLKLCKLMEVTDDAEYGINEHHRRVLNKLLINIQEISNILILLSIKKKV